ncbi:glycoside hydrolase family 92 protein [Flaviaesturariibacter flavus]|uniref:Glycoside hydrolase family 92 protein n=2 Tax=Flaviaesturariibacter flavus TaxID=2502780 RepID=A0A4R1BNZ2_9BACT|nr:glycoside hydrolase family 92 protein [Flaviaesturariibacter flavus]
MKQLRLLVLALAFPASLLAQKDYTRLVNPFIGTGGHGHTYPGASVPFGMMQLSPDTRMDDWDGSSGYHYSDSVIYGFSHTHLSGTGIPDYCDLLLMPFTGPTKWKNTEYRSPFSHKSEVASPGYYEVFLKKGNIKAQLTTTTRAGMHQYTFPSGTKTGSLLIDLQHRDEVLDARLEVVDSRTVRGYRRSKSWAKDQHFYFYIRFDRPFGSNSSEYHDGFPNKMGGLVEGKDAKAGLVFELGADRQLRCRVGISGVSMEGAKANLDAEIGAKSFAQVHSEARASWNRSLGKIDITGGTRDQQVTFYTALYHTYLVPNTWQDVDGQYRGTDGQVHRAEGFTNHSVFSLWDTYRAYHPLMTILEPKRTADWINTFLHQYKEGGMLPVWELSGNETFCMIGYHSVPVIVDAWQKGIRGFDAQLALEAMRSYAESDRFGLDFYRRQGYIANNQEHESVSKTLEYAYDDWCIAQFARWNGNDSVYRRYIRRAQNFKNLFDPQTHLMRGKLQARWHSPFDPREINNFFTEGNSWHYSFAAPQDVQGLMALHGGAAPFEKKLDELFTTAPVTTGREQPDVTGLIGQYAQGNEPSHHMAYLYNYAGRWDKTQDLVHRICTEFYRNAPDGLIGNEDCGQMSAWYILSALGFYPVCPGSGEYILGTPLFDAATLKLENGKTFRVIAARAKAGLWKSATASWNGSPLPRTLIAHEQIAAGGELRFNMPEQLPAKLWGAALHERPLSQILDPIVTPVPFVANESNKFRDSIQVRLTGMDAQQRIFYTVQEKGKPASAGRVYSGPFTLKQSATVQIITTYDEKQNRVLTQDFFRIPSDRSITVQSTVHPLYTGGGPDMLVDSITGGANWRAGDWQSYFNTDFEAVVDLKSVRPVRSLGVHVLQDVSPWIVYPKEVIFWGSEDGVSFTKIGRVINKVGIDSMGQQVQVLGLTVNTRARYIRVRAVNGGKLPAGHPSAGNPSHLFIDEVLIDAGN